MSPVKHLIIHAPKPQTCGTLDQQYLLLIDHRLGHNRTQISKQSKFSWFLSLLLSDVQHAVMGAVPFGEGPCCPGSAVQRGELCVSQPSAADHGRPGRHALPESCHQGGVTVRASRRCKSLTRWDSVCGPCFIASLLFLPCQALSCGPSKCQVYF